MLPQTTLAQSSPNWIDFTKPDGTTIQLLAGADTDGDGIENGLEIDGFVFDLASGEIIAWDGDESKKHYFTDPLRASTDGDPYSDLMEVTGANMPGSIKAPYNHPLVAARPIIAVYMTDYEVIPNGEISDEEGRSISDAFTNETTNEDQFGVGVEVEASLNPLELASVSASYDYSHTMSHTHSSTLTEEFNWSSARSVSESEAARLRLNVYYVNLGSAPASNVRPTFNLMLGNKVIATFKGSLNSEAQTLAPGARFPTSGSIAIDSYVAGEVDRDIVLNLEELKAVQRGTPLSIVVPQVEANILRWNETTQSFSNEITWADYEQDIDPVSITLETNIGGEAAQYQIYTGSPQFPDPLRNMRETLELIFDVEDRNGVTFIEDRRYPDFWYFATDSEEILQAKADLGPNGDMMDVPMHRGNRVILLSPGFDASPAVDNTTFSRNLEYVFASARPIDGFPITRAVASLYQEERVLEVPLEPIPGSAFISNIEPIQEIYYGGFVTVYNARGDARVEELVSPGQITSYRSCDDLPEKNFGAYEIALSGNLETLFKVNCRFSEGGLTVEQPWTEVPEEAQGIRFHSDVYVVSQNIALRATQTPGINAVQRSTDGGRTWASPAQPATSGRINGFYFLDDQKGFAVGGEGGIWRTLDAGDTWSKVAQAYTDESLSSIDFIDENHGMAVGGNGAVLRTTDGGDSWTPMTVFAPGTEVADYGKLDFSDVQYIDIQTIAITTFNAILMSYDGGNVWDIHRVQDIYASEICCVTARDVQFPTKSIGYFTGGFEPTNLFKTENGGRNWQRIALPSNASIREVYFFDANNGIVVGGTSIYHTTDGGQTWIQQRASSRVDVVFEHIHFNDGLGILAGRAKEGGVSYLFHTTRVEDNYALGPAGETFSLRPKKVLRYDGVPHLINGSTSIDQAAAVLSQYDYVILGDTGLRSRGEDANAVSKLIRHPLMVDTEMYMAVDVGVTTENLQGTDLAYAMVSWLYVFVTNFGSDFGVDRARQNEALRWANQNGTKVILDADLDELFSSAIDPTFNPNGEPLDIDESVFYFYKDYLVGQNGYVDQEAWLDESEKLAQYQDEIGFRILASTSSSGSYDEAQFHFAWHGSLIGNVFGLGWGEPNYGAGVNQAPYRERPDVSPGRAYFSEVDVDGAIVHRIAENGEIALDFSNHTYRFGESIVSIGVEDPAEAALPGRISLLQNYPNPFNHSTTIPFELEQPGPVRLDVFDLLGRRISTLVDGMHPAGQHTVRVDGSRLASGMYLYCIEAGGKSDTRRMVVVR